MNTESDYEELSLRYLLGQMAEEEQARFEEIFFGDAAVSEHLSDTENDLVDEYVRDQLSTADRNRFEHYFLVSERRREKVELARALLLGETTATVPRVVVHKGTPKWKWIFASLAGRPALSYSLGAAAFLLFLAGIWLFSEVRHLRNEVARLEKDHETRDSQQQESHRQENEEHRRNDELSAQKQELEQQLAELKRQRGTPGGELKSNAALTTFILSAGARGSEGLQKLVVPPNAGAIRLQLTLNPADEYPTYQVSLQTSTGELIRSWRNLKSRPASGTRAVAVDVRASLLRGNQFELTLNGVAKGRSETLGYYSFSVSTK